ncbi:MAG: conjugal transfer protein TrbH [Chloroflexi bacterium]|nr:conjugal transfer protein TrbH [Chloroflexota bacterium]
MMRKPFIILLLAGFLGGCVTQGSYGRYGNFIETLPAAYSARMVDDTVDRLSALYPPAKTRFTLEQQAVDPFGKALVGKLRERGYAVMEPLTQPGQSQAKGSEVPQPVPGPDLRYVVDQLGASQYLVTVKVGSQSISRAYRASANSLAPDGYWVRKE